MLTKNPYYRRGVKIPKIYKARTLNKKVSRIAKVLRQVKPEVMRYTNYSTQAVAGAAAYTTYLSPIPQGDANGQRAGLRIRPKRLIYNMRFNNTSAAPQMVRIILFRWNPDYNTPASAAFILQNDTGGASPDFLAPYNVANRDKFRVLKDTLLVANEVNTSGSLVQRKLSVPLSGHIIYRDDTSTNYEKGAVFVTAYFSGAGDYVFSVDLSYTD